MNSRDKAVFSWYHCFTSMDETGLSDISFDAVSEAFYAVLVLFVEQREEHPHDRAFKWNEIDLAYVRTALKYLTEDRRKQFSSALKTILSITALFLVFGFVRSKTSPF